jgi:FAD synthetase
MTAPSTGAPAGNVDTANGPASPLVSNTPLPFPQLCARIHDRIAAFLEKSDESPRLKSVQEQTRISLGIIEQALDQYRYVVTAPPLSRPSRIV